MLLLTLFILICLAFICYQDMRFRAVYWICFPILAISMLVCKQEMTGWKEVITDSAIGLAFFGVQILILWGYLSIKNRQFVNLTSDFLGWGDILFLLVITFYLSPVNYVLFYISSLILVLLYTIGQRIMYKNHDPQIPLAGLQALFLIFILIFCIINPIVRPYTDSWIYGV